MASLRDVEDVTMEVGVKSLMRAWDAAIERNGKTACINYFYMFHYMTFDTIGLLAFGRSFDILETGNTEIIDWFKDIFRFKNVVRIFPIVRHIPWLYPKLKKSRYNLIRIIRNAIAARRQLISETGIPPRIDIMQKFIDAVDPATGDKLTETQLLSELITMLVAGTDTTATTLSWTIMHMLNNPHVYRRVTDEVRSQFPDTSKPIVFGEAKSKLPYLSAVLQESMRLTSVSSGLTPRTLPRDGTTIQGYFMPHGTHIALTFAACHHNASVWKHPDTFDPERFLGKDADENAKSVLTFSTGVRICAGRNLALVEMYTTLANILRRYNISLPSDSPYGPHRKDERGAPITIPGKSDGVYGPENPKVNCLINISLA
ncbi:hypothetical protein EC988_003274 [Linderina pennispora]|nr:hypothetical protein EC988_003274 [Linderina pennispora]